ncbi:MAG: protein translocase subunit SecD [Anaerolineae bacterium]|nr:protein translocase subunit SecD [Anaerolineae bacterium]
MNLAIILVILAAAIWIDLPNNGITIGNFSRTLDIILGLDLRGGMQVLLEADVPQDVSIDPQSLQDARTILENRSNGLGVSEVVFQVAGTRRIVGEFPGLTNTEEVISILKETGQLEFVDMGDTPLAEGTVIQTSQGGGTVTPVEPSPTSEVGQPTPTEEPVIWQTVMTGDQLKAVNVTTDSLGNYEVAFELKPEGRDVFAEFTSNNINKYLAIVLDKRIISTPIIRNAITEGSGVIQGNFDYDSANALAIQLRYGSLPVPLSVVETRVIGPTLGQDSLERSYIAGLIGFAIVALFMLIYYRLPGAVAVLAIINYALITLALFKLIPVTLTLPGIAGFLLSTGGALDANILIFERLKEELRAGRNLQTALDLGWKRAWSSIRDSNIATLITSGILFWFGSTYGASIVKGFALTLALGVIVSVLNAVFVTRTFLSISSPLVKNSRYKFWFGI